MAPDRCLRRLLAALGVALLAAPAQAQQAAPASAQLKLDKSLRSGYAFDFPRVLAQQRIFGLAHGIALLVAACRQAEREDALEAYSAWRARQARTISVAIADLSAYYFGSGIANWESLTQKLALPDSLPYAPGSAELRAACETLPQALAEPRYDFATRFRLEEAMAQVVASAEADARNGACRKILAGDERKVHEERFQLWREINAPAAWNAAETLAREWPADAPAASYAEWIATLRKEIHARGDRAACLEFSASLKRPESFLRNVFRVPQPGEGVR